MDTEAQLKELFEESSTIAVVGIKDGEGEDAFRVPRYLQRAGYQIRPVNPKLDRVLDETCVASLDQLTSDPSNPIDIVNLFRASEHVPDHVDEILALDPKPRAVWMQLGIHHGPSAQRLRDAGIQVVQDRCIMVDHRALTAKRADAVARGDNDRLVYSSADGRICPACGRTESRCKCRGKGARARLAAREAAEAARASDGIVRVSRSTKGRKGKTVSLVTGVPARIRPN